MTNEERAQEIRRITMRFHSPTLTEMNIRVDNVLTDPYKLAVDVELFFVMGQFESFFNFTGEQVELALATIGYDMFAAEVKDDRMRLTLARNERATEPLPTAIEHALINAALQAYNRTYTGIRGHASIIAKIKWWYDPKWSSQAGWYAECNDGLGDMHMGKTSEEAIQNLMSRIFYLGRESGVDYQRGSGKPLMPFGPLDVSL